MLLIAFAIYNDGINTIIRMAAPYGAQMGLAREHLIAAILLVQFLGVPFTFLFGMAAGWIGPKRAVFIALGVYAVISTLAYYMTTVLHFYLLALLVATVQGGSQALSRSMYLDDDTAAQIVGILRILRRPSRRLRLKFRPGHGLKLT
jgi:UMF1 family MFS transporter